MWDGCESEVRRNLQSLGFECEYPITRLPRNNRGERRVVPLFPGYVFVRESDEWKSVQSVRGCCSVLANDGCPSLISDVDVQFFLTGSVDSLGYYVDPSCRVLRQGDHVTFGPGIRSLAGLGGEFVRMVDDARCEIAFWLLGRRVRSTFAVVNLT